AAGGRAPAPRAARGTLRTRPPTPTPPIGRPRGGGPWRQAPRGFPPPTARHQAGQTAAFPPHRPPPDPPGGFLAEHRLEGRAPPVHFGHAKRSVRPDLSPGSAPARR